MTSPARKRDAKKKRKLIRQGAKRKRKINRDGSTPPAAVLFEIKQEIKQG